MAFNAAHVKAVYLAVGHQRFMQILVKGLMRGMVTVKEWNGVCALLGKSFPESTSYYIQAH